MKKFFLCQKIFYKKLDSCKDQNMKGPECQCLDLYYLINNSC